MSETEGIKDDPTHEHKGSNKNGDEKAADLEVHSANAWEDADLGDEGRKNKFLRLMGAGKKEHHGRFVIGDHNPEHARKKDETRQLQHQLEDQYTQSMQHRLASGRRGHVGLGYHDADKPTETQDDPQQQEDKADTEDKPDEEEGEEEKEEEGEKDSEEAEEKANRKRESSGDGVEEDAPVEKKLKTAEDS